MYIYNLYTILYSDSAKSISAVGKIQNLSSSVGFITTTFLGRIDFSENVYFRKETIEKNLGAGVMDLRDRDGKRK